MEAGNTINNDKKTEPSPVSGENKNKAWVIVLDWTKTIIIALVISLPIRFFIAEPFIVNGASMDPTFSTRQFLIVDRISYRFEAPKRGDVIVFKYPNNPSIYYIKRIIGLPGETLNIVDGKVSVCADKSCSASTTQVLDETYVASLHFSHDTLRVQVDQEKYFVMGDNRAQSSDSRAWGELPADLIIGRPVVRLLPISSISIMPGQK